MVERIIADRKITREERKELHEALEKVLPPDLRKDAKAKRREVEENLKRRERPLHTLDFMVAGVKYEGRAEIIARHVKEGDQVFLVRDRNNAYSKNAGCHFPERAFGVKGLPVIFLGSLGGLFAHTPR